MKNRDEAPHQGPELRQAKDLPLTRLLPNILTMMALCSGLTAMRYALHGAWREAVLAVVLAAIFDVLDGRVARMLNLASKFGAELDSLADAISFGVAPSFVTYEWALKEGPSLGWIAVLIYTVCTALRLARFNTMLEDHTLPPWTKSYFMGVPAPGAAGLALVPLIASIEYGAEASLPPTFIALWLILVGGLMVSRIPTFALKGWRVSPAYVIPIFIGVALFLAEIVSDTWLALLTLLSVYMCSMPMGWYSYHSRMKREKKADD